MKEHNLVTLKKLESANAPLLSKYANNKKVWDNLRDYMPFPYTIKHAEEFIELNQNIDPATAFGIYYQDAFCGIIGVNLMKDVYSHVAEIGYWIGEPYWGKGIMTIAVKLMVKHCFDNLGLIRLHTGVFEYNKASMKVLENAGFVKEGAFILGVRKNNKLVDELRYGLINPAHTL